MYSMIISIIKEGAVDQLDNYLNHPFDLFETYYEFTDFYRTPVEWLPLLGERKQMDWGSWLSICTYEQVQKLFSIKQSLIAKISSDEKNKELVITGERKPVSNLPKAELYGIMEIEDY